MPQPNGTTSDYGIVGSHYKRATLKTMKFDGYRYATTYSKSQEMPVTRNNRKVNGHYASGGDWLMYKHWYNTGSSNTKTFRPPWGMIYEGKYNLNGTYGTTALSVGARANMMSDLRARGAEAWNALRPDEPDFSLAVSLAELRELPRLLRLRLKDLIIKIKNAKKKGRKRAPTHKGLHKRFADRKLAMEFGWLPLLDDIKNFTEVFNDKHKRLDKLIKNESKPLHRSSQVSSPHDSSNGYVTNYSNGYGPGGVGPSHVTQAYNSNYKARLSVKNSTTYETWAVGQFRYLLPPGPRTEGWKRKMYRRIMGGRLTPSVVYNLIPWSWLVDYFTDLGQFIDAISPGVADKLYADYAYVMRKVEIRKDVRVKIGVCTSKVHGPGKHVHIFRNDRTVVKMRVRASPFGFGLKERDLSPKQIGILGALGLSRLP